MRNCGAKTQAGVARGLDSRLVNYTGDELLTGQASLGKAQITQAL